MPDSLFQRKIFSFICSSKKVIVVSRGWILPPVKVCMILYESPCIFNIYMKEFWIKIKKIFYFAPLTVPGGASYTRTREIATSN
jgi:hypothetical protein